ncbi:GNAT family N-acetyltransferase [Winogradskyella luteola]|uniref:GNAT family N-acetyltransferase n=1 Tax=Winogradskyella luteola TaxID=2828330 RepID=A0A9X1JNR0_9FLAO|nr:GNAT family N-acetyltransferase [Winogradskyella luteola]MBV7267924.1 GNAT family N-acetyltransferase [Winogradskyella luteola]
MIKGIFKRVLSKTEAFGLKRDLTVKFEVPNAQIELLTRPCKASDEIHFTADLQNYGLVQENIPTCYVATNTEGKPCYRQWLMGSKQNENIKAFWGESFPELKDDEALVESVFTTPAFRRKGIMPAALDSISKKVQDLGVRYVILFVEVGNIPSLKGCHRSGFSPYVLRIEKWFFFKRSVIFEAVSEVMMNDYFKRVDSH